MSKTIRLDVQFTATISDTDEHIPLEFNHANEVVTVVLPMLDAEYVVFPKMLEGVTDRVISQLHTKLSAWYTKKAKEEERLRQAAMRPPLFAEKEA